MWAFYVEEVVKDRSFKSNLLIQFYDWTILDLIQILPSVGSLACVQNGDWCQNEFI